MSFLYNNLLGILVACIVILVYKLLKKKLNYFTDRGMVYVKPTWSELKNSFSFSALLTYPTIVYDKTQNFDSPYVGYFTQIAKPSILIRDPSLATNILIRDFSHFQDHGFDVDAKTNPLAAHLFNMNGDEWRTLRHKLVPTFTSGKLKGMVPIMEECADILIKKIKEEPSLQKDTNLKELFRNYSLSVIASTAFGIDPESVQTPNNPFRKVLHEVVNPTWKDQVRVIVTLLLPRLARLLNLKLFSREGEEFILSLTKQSFEHRKNTGMKRNDFIQLLLELREKGSVELDVKDLEHDETEAMSTMQSETPSAKLELTDELLAAQVFVFLFAGYENLAFLSTLTMYMLSKHPDIQSRVRDEVKEKIAKNDGLNYQAIREMNLLAATIDETLRIHNPNIVIMRRCNKDYTLSDGKVIEKGVTLMIPATSLQLDSKYWPNPKEFIPERFFSKDNIHPGTYLPFGDGPRLCIAQRLALLMTKVMMAKLLLNYELEPSPKTKEPAEIVVTFTADNKGGFWGSFKELSN